MNIVLLIVIIVVGISLYLWMINRRSGIEMIKANLRTYFQRRNIGHSHEDSVSFMIWNRYEHLPKFRDVAVGFWSKVSDKGKDELGDLKQVILLMLYLEKGKPDTDDYLPQSFWLIEKLYSKIKKKTEGKDATLSKSKEGTGGNIQAPVIIAEPRSKANNENLLTPSLAGFSMSPILAKDLRTLQGSEPDIAKQLFFRAFCLAETIDLSARKKGREEANLEKEIYRIFSRQAVFLFWNIISPESSPTYWQPICDDIFKKLTEAFIKMPSEEYLLAARLGEIIYDKSSSQVNQNMELYMRHMLMFSELSKNFTNNIMVPENDYDWLSVWKDTPPFNEFVSLMGIKGKPDLFDQWYSYVVRV